MASIRHQRQNAHIFTKMWALLQHELDVYSPAKAGDQTRTSDVQLVMRVRRSPATLTVLILRRSIAGEAPAARSRREREGMFNWAPMGVAIYEGCGSSRTPFSSTSRVPLLRAPTKLLKIVPILRSSACPFVGSQGIKANHGQNIPLDANLHDAVLRFVEGHAGYARQQVDTNRRLPERGHGVWGLEVRSVEYDRGRAELLQSGQQAGHVGRCSTVQEVDGDGRPHVAVHADGIATH